MHVLELRAVSGTVVKLDGMISVIFAAAPLDAYSYRLHWKDIISYV